MRSWANKVYSTLVDKKRAAVSRATPLRDIVTIFPTRTSVPFWSHRPARILWVAVLGTQTVVTLTAVYGAFMMPLGWGWAAFVWGYPLVWFVLNDRVKLFAYQIFDAPKAAVPSDRTPQIGERARAGFRGEWSGPRSRQHGGSPCR